MTEISQKDTAKLQLIHRGPNKVFIGAHIVLPNGERARLPLTNAKLQLKPNNPGEYTITLYARHVDVVSEESLEEPSKDTEEKADSLSGGPYDPCDICGTTWRYRCGRLGCV